jgi:hypothetical protein
MTHESPNQIFELGVYNTNQPVTLVTLVPSIQIESTNQIGDFKFGAFNQN